MKPRACLIFNPVAGQGDADQEKAIIAAELAPHFELEIYLTSTEIGTNELTQNAVDKGATLVIAAGGDGTIAAVASGVQGTDIPLGIISRGTVNAFASAFNLPSSVESACQVIVEGHTCMVDLAICNGQPTTLLTAIGFEAETIDQTNRNAKDRLGVFAYVLTALRELRNLEQFTAEIETGDRLITVSASAITIANVAPPQLILAQGPAKITPDDGLLDLTIVAPQGFASAIAASFELFRSGLNDAASQRPDVGFVRGERFRITTDPPQKVALDGDMFGTTPIEVSCLPRVLKLIVPQVQPQSSPQERLEQLPDLIVQSKNP